MTEQNANSPPNANNSVGQPSGLYAAAGVDIESGNRAVDLMQAAVRSTYTPQVLADVGSFGGLFALPELTPQPLLVASTDGVGTKVKLAAQHNRWQVSAMTSSTTASTTSWRRARDRYSSSTISPPTSSCPKTWPPSCLVWPRPAAPPTARSSAAKRPKCRASTRLAPATWPERSWAWSTAKPSFPARHAIQPGDLLLGLPSSGPHTNGYSLIRRTVAARDPQQPLEDGTVLIDALLAPHRSYLSAVRTLEEAGILIKGLAHITGGGFVDNLPRILPPGLRAQIDRSSWEVPLLFRRLLAWSGMERDEAYRVFNMGIGMVVIIADEQARLAHSALPDAVPIGELVGSDQADPDVALVG